MGGTPAWDLARRAANNAGVSIRPLASLEEADEVVRVMAGTWGPPQLVPRELIRAFQASGNAPLGALRGEELVGFVLGFLGSNSEGIHLHSHMLAVVPAVRSAGVGYALKLAQRAAALDIGVTLARWTFDPLQARNAYFNLVKLGAVADGFHREFYGEMTDALNRDDRSDRLEARWDLAAEPGPGEASSEGAVEIEIPTDYPAVKEGDPERARALREAVARAIEDCFASGLVATGFRKEGAYLFTPAPKTTT